MSPGVIAACIRNGTESEPERLPELYDVLKNIHMKENPDAPESHRDISAIAYIADYAIRADNEAVMDTKGKNRSIIDWFVDERSYGTAMRATAAYAKEIGLLPKLLGR